MSTMTARRLALCIALLACLGGPAAAVAATCAGHTPLHLRLTRLHGSRVLLRWHAPAAGAPAAYRVLLAGRTVGQSTHTAMSMPVVLGHTTTFTVQARYARTVCAARLRNGLALRPPSRVLGLRLLGDTATGVRIAWRRARAGDAPLAGYRVIRDGSVVAQTRALSFTVKLSAARAHRLTVAAVDTRGRLGPPSRPLDIGAHPAAGATHADAATGTLPGAPGTLSVSEVSEAGATLWWTPAIAGSQRIIGYRVYRDGGLVGQTTADTLRLTHLAPLHTYEIAVAAVDALHHEGPRTPTLKLSTSHVPPGGPALISALSVTDTSATLAWQPGSANSGTLVGYLLYENGSPEGVVHGLTTTVSLASNATYTFTVRALDSYGYLSAPAPTLTVVTTHTPPSTPRELHAGAVGESSATLSWSPSTPVSGTIVGYRVFRDGLPVGQTTATEMMLSDLAPETAYTLTVQAVQLARRRQRADRAALHPDRRPDPHPRSHPGVPACLHRPKLLRPRGPLPAARRRLPHLLRMRRRRRRPRPGLPARHRLGARPPHRSDAAPELPEPRRRERDPGRTRRRAAHDRNARRPLPRTRLLRHPG